MSLKLHWSLVGCLLLFAPGRSGAQNITDFFPKVGTTNDTVFVTGSGFFNNGDVTFQFFNRKTATKNVTSDSQAVLHVPVGVTPGAFAIGVFKTVGAITTNFTG